MEISANNAAFATVVIGSVATIGLSIATVGAASAVAMGVFGSMALVGSGFTIGSVTAWFASEKGDSANDYFNKLTEHVGTATAAVFAFVSQTLVTAIINGLAQVASDVVRFKVGNWGGMDSVPAHRVY